MNLEKKYLVKINTPNKVFPLRTGMIRTPFEVILSQRELDLLKMRIRLDGSITDWTCEEYLENVIKNEDENKPEIQKLENKPTRGRKSKVINQQPEEKTEKRISLKDVQEIVNEDSDSNPTQKTKTILEMITLDDDFSFEDLESFDKGE